MAKNKSNAEELVDKIIKNTILTEKHVRIGHKSNPAIGPEPYVILELKNPQAISLRQEHIDNIRNKYDKEEAERKIKQDKKELEQIRDEQEESLGSILASVRYLIKNDRRYIDKGFGVFESTKPNKQNLYAIKVKNN